MCRDQTIDVLSIYLQMDFKTVVGFVVRSL